MVDGFDTSKFTLGVICKRGHDWNGSGQSLRRISNGDCIECNRVRGNRHYAGKGKPERAKAAQEREQRKQELNQWLDQVLIDAGVDVSRYRLSALCYKGHQWNGINYSLKWRSGSICVECARERYEALTPEQISQHRLKQAEWKENNRDAHLEKKRQYHHANKERIASAHRIYYLANKDRMNQAARLRYQQKKDAHRVYSAAYSKSDRGKLVRSVAQQRRRARKRSVHSVRYTAIELQQHYQKFDNRCSYCGATEKLTPDHFIAIVHGGSNTLGNIVPACVSCNSSKQESDPLEWFSRQKFYSKQKWREILRVLGKSEDNYNQIPLL